jgi:uncharacterized SAM-binding protein YcdF (DUF218 family)
LSRRWWAIAIVASVATGAWLVREPLLRGAAALWIVSDPVTRADAIVVLGGNYQVRPRFAADLYRRGLADRILVSETGDAQRAATGSLPTEAELNRDALVKLGVPPDAVESFGAANVNTREEAVALREWAERNGAAKVIVPSEIFSARRVQWIFRRELSGSGVAIMVPSFDPSGYTRTDWWKTENGVTAFQGELLKYAYYRLNY